MSKKIELDPDDREWEYDGDGNKIYKLEANKPVKTEWKEVEPYTINLDSYHDERFPTRKPLREVDLDGGVPMEKNYLRESEVVSFKMNGDGNEST